MRVCMLKCSEILKLSILFTLLTGCQGFQKKQAELWNPQTWKDTTGPELVELKLKNVSATEVTKYQARLYQKEYKKTDLVREKQSVVDFVVKNKKLKKTKNNLLVWELETIEKSGVFPLNTMAFPELNQKIPFTLEPSGQIVQAGSFHQDSIFYSPIIVLPKNKVKIGETWANSFQWRDSENSPTYEMSIVSTHKGFVRCGDETCVDIDISGSVDILGLDKEKNDFRSNMQGRIYFDYKKGSIVYAHMKSQDEFITEEARTESQSCLSSVLQKPRYIDSDKVPCKISESL